MKPLAGKVIVVTGGGRGVGAGVCREVARLGANVVVADIDDAKAIAVADAITAAGNRAEARACDVADWHAAAALIAGCVDRHGRIDGLVNAAGLMRMGTLVEMTEGLFDAMFTVNVAGTAYCAHHAAIAMSAQGSGAIVNFVSGSQMGIPEMGAYGASKGAVASFTYTWALELAGAGVRVNAVSPMGMTRMVDVATTYHDERSLPHHVNVMPDPSANAGTISFLLSDRAKDITGQIVRVEGNLLSLIVHPAIAAPVLDRPEWDFESVADAFDRDLRARLLPVGVSSLEVRPAAGGTNMWHAEDAPTKR